MGDILSVLGRRCLVGCTAPLLYTFLHILSSSLFLLFFPLSRLSPSHLSIPLKSLFLSLSLFSYLFSFLVSLHFSPLLPHPLVSLNLISPVVYLLFLLSFLPSPLVFSHFLFSPFPGLTSPLISISHCLFCPPLLHSPPPRLPCPLLPLVFPLCSCPVWRTC